MSPRHWGENEMNLKSFWAVDIHDLFASSFLLNSGPANSSAIRINPNPKVVRRRSNLIIGARYLFGPIASPTRLKG
jgi:hypothetical protein